MKEQFNNSFGKKLEEISRLKPEAHFVIDDLAFKALSSIPLTSIEKNSLDDISMELQELDRDITSYLFNIKLKNIISEDECFVAISYFLASKQIGPESGEIRKLFYESNINPEEFEKLIQGISIPNNTRQIIIRVYNKVYYYGKNDLSIKLDNKKIVSK